MASVAALLSRSLLERAVLRPYLIARGSDYWRLLTSGFVHADIAHLLFNLITFYSFAFTLERVIGTPRFVSLYLCGLLASGIGTCIKHRNEPNYASLGASGAILAVLFASIVYFPRQRLVILPIPVPIPADCSDGFEAAYWRRPQAILEQPAIERPSAARTSGGPTGGRAPGTLAPHPSGTRGNSQGRICQSPRIQRCFRLEQASWLPG